MKIDNICLNQIVNKLTKIFPAADLFSSAFAMCVEASFPSLASDRKAFSIAAAWHQVRCHGSSRGGNTD